MAADRANCSRCSGCLCFVAHETYRNVCKGCYCPLDSHRILSKVVAPACSKAAIGWPSEQGLTNGVHSGEGRATRKMAMDSMGDFAWIPTGIEPDTVLRYFASLPVAKVPYVGSDGERYRLEQLERQLPPHDGAAGCFVAAADSTAEQRECGSFWERRAAEAAGRGRIVVLPTGGGTAQPSCKECRGLLKPGDVAVLASRHLGADTYCHPACFVCKTCRELLVDMTYFVHVGDADGGGQLELYCGRHHAERLKPRCAACDEIIFADECTEAEDRCWHISHFCCFECGAQLGGCRYVMHDGRPHCCPCFEQRFAVACSTCRERIGVVQGHMMHGDTRWHATAECFRCHCCSKSLLGEAFLPKADGAIFCSTRCCDAAASPVADGDRPFVGVGRTLSPCHQQLSPPAGDERWTEDAGSRLLGGENFSEGYGSLRNCPSLLRRSLPDVTAASVAESSDDDGEDDERAIASSRLVDRRGSDRSAMSFRQQRRLAFELRRSCRRRRSEATSGKSRWQGRAEAAGGHPKAIAARPCEASPAVAALPEPFVAVVAAGSSNQRPPTGPACGGRATAAAEQPHRPHLPTSSSVGSFPSCVPAAQTQIYAASPAARPRAPRMGNWPLPPLPATAVQLLQLPQQQKQQRLQPAPTMATSSPAGQPMQPRSGLTIAPSPHLAMTAATTTKVQPLPLRTDDDEDDDDDGYQEGGRCRHTGGVCPLCTSGSSSSSSDGEDVAYEEEVERSRGLRVARDLSRRRASLPQKLVSRQVSAKVVQAAAKTAKQRRTRSGNCVVQ